VQLGWLSRVTPLSASTRLLSNCHTHTISNGPISAVSAYLGAPDIIGRVAPPPTQPSSLSFSNRRIKYLREIVEFLETRAQLFRDIFQLPACAPVTSRPETKSSDGLSHRYNRSSSVNKYHTVRLLVKTSHQRRAIRATVRTDCVQPALRDYLKVVSRRQARRSRVAGRQNLGRRRPALTELTSLRIGEIDHNSQWGYSPGHGRRNAPSCPCIRV